MLSVPVASLDNGIVRRRVSVGSGHHVRRQLDHEFFQRVLGSRVAGAPSNVVVD